MKRREFVKYGLTFAAGLCLSVALPRIGGKEILLPPGASDDFLKLCTSCGRCIDACPTHGLKPTSILENLFLANKPELEGYCCVYLELVDPIPEVSEKIKSGELEPTPCRRCIESCPTGALKEGDIRIGIAEIDRSICLGWLRETCDRCVRICPLEAVVLKGGKPHVVEERCIGCKLCEHICPTRPKAITVEKR